MGLVSVKCFLSTVNHHGRRTCLRHHELWFRIVPDCHIVMVVYDMIYFTSRQRIWQDKLTANQLKDATSDSKQYDTVTTFAMLLSPSATGGLSCVVEVTIISMNCPNGCLNNTLCNEETMSDMPNTLIQVNMELRNSEQMRREFTFDPKFEKRNSHHNDGILNKDLDFVVQHRIQIMLRKCFNNFTPHNSQRQYYC